MLPRSTCFHNRKIFIVICSKLFYEDRIFFAEIQFLSCEVFLYL